MRRNHFSSTLSWRIEKVITSKLRSFLVHFESFTHHIFCIFRQTLVPRNYRGHWGEVQEAIFVHLLLCLVPWRLIPVNALRYSSPVPLFINNTKVLSTPMRCHIALSLLVFKSMRFRCHRQRIDRLVSTLKRSKTIEFARCQWRRLNSIYENTRVWDIFNRRFHSAASGRFRIRCKVFLQLKLLY